MTPLSVAIITFNEEANIGRCLDAALPIADDIVVVDSYSSDQTKEICGQYPGVRFLQHPFEGHIQQKNHAITRARYPHILSLDADEVLTKALQHKILQVKENWQYDGYYINRLTNYCGKWIYHSGWYPDRKLRLWDSRKGKWGGVNPHDKYEMQAGTTTAQLKGDLLHYSYPTLNSHLRTIEKFSEIKANHQLGKKHDVSKLKTIFGTPAKFFKHYILKKGFLDGYYGFAIAVISSYYYFITYFKLWLKHHEASHD